MPVDFSRATQPQQIPETPTSRGMRHFGDALDAVLARRQQLEMQRQQHAQQMKHYEMVDARAREQMEATQESTRENRELRKSMFGVTSDLKATGQRTQAAQAAATLFAKADELAAAGLHDQAANVEAQAEALLGQSRGRPQASSAQSQDQPKQTQAAQPQVAQPQTAQPVTSQTAQPAAPAPAGAIEPPAQPEMPLPGTGEPTADPAPAATSPVGATPPGPITDPAAARVAAMRARGPDALADAWREGIRTRYPDPKIQERADAIQMAWKQSRGKMIGKDADKELGDFMAMLQSGINAEKMRTGIRPGEAGRLEESQLAGLDRRFENWKQETGYQGAVDAFRKLGEAENEIKSGNALTETGVRFAIGKAIAGAGVFTEGEQKKILDSVGGKLEEWASVVQRWVSGNMTPEGKAVFADYIARKRDHIRSKVTADMTKNYRDYFLGPRTRWPQFRDELVSRHNSIFQSFGVPPLDEAGNPTGDMFGSPVRPASQPRAPGAAPGPVPATAAPRSMGSRLEAARRRAGLPAGPSR